MIDEGNRTHADTTLKILRHGKSLSTFDEKALMDASEWSRFDIVMHWDERVSAVLEGCREMVGAAADENSSCLIIQKYGVVSSGSFQQDGPRCTRLMYL